MDRTTIVTAVRIVVDNNSYRYVESAVPLQVQERTNTEGILLGNTVIPETLEYTYEASAIEVGRIRYSSKLSNTDSVLIKLPRTLQVVDRLLSKNLTSPSEVIINELQFTTTNIGVPIYQEFKGEVVNLTYDSSTCTVEVKTPAQEVATLGLKRKYSKLCPYRLYGKECGVFSGDFSSTFVASHTFGETSRGIPYIIMDDMNEVDHPAGKFKGGVAKFVLLGKLYEVGVAYNKGSALFLENLPDDMPTSGQKVTMVVRRGCDLTADTCYTVFNNLKRFGGFPYFDPQLNAFLTDTFIDDSVTLITKVDSSVIDPDIFTGS